MSELIDESSDALPRLSVQLGYAPHLSLQVTQFRFCAGARGPIRLW